MGGDICSRIELYPLSINGLSEDVWGGRGGGGNGHDLIYLLMEIASVFNYTLLRPRGSRLTSYVRGPAHCRPSSAEGFLTTVSKGSLSS